MIFVSCGSTACHRLSTTSSRYSFFELFVGLVNKYLAGSVLLTINQYSFVGLGFTTLRRALLHSLSITVKRYITSFFFLCFIHRLIPSSKPSDLFLQLGHSFNCRLVLSAPLNCPWIRPYGFL